MTKSLQRLKKRIDSYFDKNEFHVTTGYGHVDNFKKGIEYHTAPIPSGNVGIYTWPGSNTVGDWVDIFPFEYLDDIVTDFIDENGMYCALVKTELGTVVYTSQINQSHRLRDFLMEIEVDLPWTNQTSL